MKKIIAVGAAAAAMLAFSGTAVHADDYEPTTETNVQPEPNKEPEPGKKVRFIVKPGVQGDAAQCTGQLVAVYKAGAKVLKQREKAVDEQVAFNGKIPANATKVVFIYQRGEQDPCDKSKTNIKF